MLCSPSHIHASTRTHQVKQAIESWCDGLFWLPFLTRHAQRVVIVIPQRFYTNFKTMYHKTWCPFPKCWLSKYLQFNSIFHLNKWWMILQKSKVTMSTSSIFFSSENAQKKCKDHNHPPVPLIKRNMINQDISITHQC
jgi:hypothetical protein